MYSLSVLTALVRRISERALSPLAAACLWLVLLAAPHSVSAQTFLAEWGFDDIGRIGPTGLALDTSGSTTLLYVADQPGGRILKIDAATGARLAVWGQTGNGPLEFNSPYGVAVDPVSHDIYVAERTNHRIQRLTANGVFVMGWGELGTEPGKFDGPIGVAADAQGNVYVVDHNNNRVQKFHVQGSAGNGSAQLVTTWGGPGSAAGQFNAPYGLALDAQGNVWVADGGNHRVQKFDANGQFLAAIGTFGTGPGQFVTPVWVSFDSAGALYVSESNSDPTNPAAPDLANQRVQKFKADGTYVLGWGTYGEGPTNFKLPFQVVVDAQQNAYVSDYYNTRVVKYSLNAAPAGGRFVNISSRLRVSSGRSLIAGFVISGTAPKQVLIRGVGPTLSALNVSNPLPNPGLRVYSGQTVIASNEDWGGNADVAAAASRLYAFGLPATSKDAALLVTLQPGLYTTQVTDNGGDGVGLVEVYDADTSPGSSLVNVSTRGYVEPGDAGVLVAGFVISGTAPKRVLIRAAGPSLTQLQVPDALPDPVLRVYNSDSKLIAQNDNWEVGMTVTGGVTVGTLAELRTATTATGTFGFGAGGKDAAVLLTLPPGLYSAMVSTNGTAGTGLVEVYGVP
ncbi:SMP-30/gluconolactonase/LRE family protein [Opitutus sp. ER46]|uniref:SMP-30/gluconolactonase/LRE family protein n=1 Tax=Opitutus sp. ER46 TaxID=2161864 RepID=UPI000D30F2A9|nr:SMP-30/gluconolactonase/LRE family protein [Opitutus sp. ER46]PTX91776.1 hypothetical protein DB354_18130 [Opitutus sp. ER46]